MSDARKTMTIRASELRVGDHIINIGTVNLVKARSNADWAIVEYTNTSGIRLEASFARLLTIERHEPDVVVRYFADRPEDGFASLDEIERGPGWAVTKFTWHDGVLRSVEIVSHEGDGP